MFKPHYWYHGNHAMPSEKLNDIFSLVNNTDVKKLLDEDKNHLTTYHTDNVNINDFFDEYYNKIGTQIIKKAGLYTVTKFDVLFWSQIYSKLMNHSAHNHTGFNLDNDRKLDALLSWVHFLKVPEQKCFKFTDSEGNNSFYPDEQNSGDIIYFPSWAYHEIDPNRSDDLRVVIAGNITVTQCLD